MEKESLANAYCVLLEMNACQTVQECNLEGGFLLYSSGRA